MASVPLNGVTFACEFCGRVVMLDPVVRNPAYCPYCPGPKLMNPMPGEPEETKAALARLQEDYKLLVGRNDALVQERDHAQHIAKRREEEVADCMRRITELDERLLEQRKELLATLAKTQGEVKEFQKHAKHLEQSLAHENRCATEAWGKLHDAQTHLDRAKKQVNEHEQTIAILRRANTNQVGIIAHLQKDAACPDPAPHEMPTEKVTVSPPVRLMIRAGTADVHTTYTVAGIATRETQLWPGDKVVKRWWNGMPFLLRLSDLTLHSLGHRDGTQHMLYEEGLTDAARRGPDEGPAAH